MSSGLRMMRISMIPSRGVPSRKWSICGFAVVGPNVSYDTCHYFDLDWQSETTYYPCSSGRGPRRPGAGTRQRILGYI